MRNLLIFALFAALSFAVEIPETFAQSGAKASGGGGGGARRSSGGARRSSGGGGTARRSVRRPTISPAERARQAQLAQQQYQAQVAQAKELGKAQYLQTLNQLADSQNKSQNASQNREAFEEAKRDYQALQNGDVLPNQLGGLQVPYRLTTREIDRRRGRATWPEPLQASEFETLVGSINESIESNSVTDAESAKMFLDELSTLDQMLNTAAVNREMGIKDFAKSRRFITGLANEVRSTGLLQE